MKAPSPDFLLSMFVISVVAVCAWAYDTFRPPYLQFGFSEFLDIPNLAPRKYFILELVKRIDAACDDMTVDKLERICCQPLCNKTNVYWWLATKGSDSGWEAGTDENCDNLGVEWSRNKCGIKVDDIKAIFGEGKVKEPKPSRCMHYPTWLVYKRPRGMLGFQLGERGILGGDSEGYVLGASFWRDTITARDRIARSRTPKALK